jgi:diguanylate cyclase (GGDEF)-like protein
MDRTDPLTGLLNQRAILELLEREAERLWRGGPSFAVAMADVDGLQQVNDSHGHEVGDQLLVHVASLLARTVRAQDVVARWHGGELLVFLPATPLEGAVLAAEKIRGAVGDSPQRVGGRDLNVTVSVGVAAPRPPSTAPRPRAATGWPGRPERPASTRAPGRRDRWRLCRRRQRLTD